MVAKDDNTEAGESKKDERKQDKDSPMDSDEQEKIHKQVDEVSREATPYYDTFLRL